jgi:hypothetical protein
VRRLPESSSGVSLNAAFPGVKALVHERKGVRGVYNKAEYLNQRREMLQWWADLVDAQIEEGRKVVIGRFEKAFQAA